MSTEITVPQLGESVSEATVAKWLKAVGDTIAQDEPLVELETDKVTLEVNAPSAGVLGEILVEEGATVEVGAVLGHVAAQGGAPARKAESGTESKPAEPERPAAKATEPAEQATSSEAAQALSPAVRRLVEENDLDPSRIAGSGKDGRLIKADVLAHLEKTDGEGSSRSAAATPDDGARGSGGEPAAPASASRESPASAPAPAASAPSSAAPPAEAAPREERVRMSRLRQRIAERLKQAQDDAAMLTTFNEVDMTAVMALRKQYRDAFERRHGVRLGFMSFFIKACIAGLKEIPAVNAEIDGTDIIYKNHYDIGVAVGTPQGLVVPVVRDVDRLGFGAIEKTIGDLGKKARDGKLTIDDLTGGTFTISNGGVYGSLMSTPILNPPQSAILGMHKIQPRPMAIGDAVEIRPMMYLALSYDHRIIDGREAVTFLVRVKEAIEDPQRLLIEI